MIVLDTNVVSEMMRNKPEPKVLDWLKSHSRVDLFISVMTIMELKFGHALLPDGPDKQILDRKIDELISSQFNERVLVFDRMASEICGMLMASKKAHIPFVKIVDLQIAATALANGFAVATRDLSDFQHAGLVVINPWTN
jgi:toxin FitB